MSKNDLTRTCKIIYPAFVFDFQIMVRRMYSRFAFLPAVAGLFGIGALTAAYFGMPLFTETVYTSDVELSQASQIEETVIPAVTHLPTPQTVRALYMTSCVVGTPTVRESLVRIAKETEINSMVIDIKDFSGTISFKTGNPLFSGVEITRCGASDMYDFIKMLHEEGIYVIGRITVFQDPEYTKAHPEEAVQSVSREGPWKDHKGLSFVDVSSRPFWEYIVALAQISYTEMGFDELNFDYVRYPSDGPMEDARYQNPHKAEALETFFKYLHEQMAPIGVVLSADVFGMTTTNEDDLNIGQVLERTIPYFDYVAPMVYPSHYPAGFNGWSNPNNHVYDVVRFSMDEAILRLLSTTTPVAAFMHVPIASTTPQWYEKPLYDKLKLRPWLQDFDYGGDYGPAEVRAQMQAVYDAGLDSWMLWSPSNKYTVEALTPEP